jgi:hypothetical protein
MAFCVLNGYVVPVAEGTAGYSVDTIGHETRAYDGTLLTDRRATKRKWTVETAPMLVTDMELMQNAVHGIGFGTSFENNLANLSNGVAPETNTGQHLVSPRVSAQGGKINDDTKLGSYGYTSTVSILNELTDNQARGGDASADTTGFAALGGSASILRSNEHAYEGTGSIKVTVTSVNSAHGITTTATNSGPGPEEVMAHVRVLLHPTMTDGRGLRARIRTTLSGTGPWVNVVGSTSQWRTISMRFSNAIATDIFIEVSDNETSGGTMIFYTDGFFMELLTDNGIPNDYVETWRVTGGPTTGGFLRYINLSMVSPFTTKATINVWCRQNSAITRANIGYVLGLANSGTDQISIYMTTTPARFGVDIRGFGAGQALGHTGTSVMGWEMLTVTWDATQATNNLKLYRNGVFAGQITVTADNFPDLDSMDRLALGCRASDGGLRFGSPVDNISVLPYIADTTQIANWFNLTTPSGALPRVYLQGDIISESSVFVDARVVEVEKLSARLGGSFRNNLRRAKIEISEV